MRRVVLSALLILAGCGGGGGSAPPANRPPAFTSAAKTSAAENVTAPVYTAVANDPDGGTLTYSLSGGADQALFTITSGGSLSFRAPPDFETRADADKDNVYVVQISVSDGAASATIEVMITVTDSFVTKRVGQGFSQPLFVTGIPDNSGRVLVIEKGGRVLILNPATGVVAATPFLDVAGSVSTDGERGLLGLALSPSFANDGTVYVYLTNNAGDIEIRRYTTLAGNRDQVDPASGDAILTIAHRVNNNHNGGWIEFGPDRLLYLGVGDGGGAGDPDNNAQNRNVLLGKLLRIDPTRDAFPADAARDYAIPASNPFAASGGAPEIYAIGLRNPFRASFDRTSGNLYIGDVGQDLREEIDFIRPVDIGANFGWPFLEGTRPYRGATTAALTPPVTEYDHGTGDRQGSSVTGGHVYRGPYNPFKGLYFFGDFVTGNIWSVPIDRFNAGTVLPSSEYTLRKTEFTPNAGTIGSIPSFGLDQIGNLYIVDFDGEIFRIEDS